MICPKDGSSGAISNTAGWKEQEFGPLPLVESRYGLERNSLKNENSSCFIETKVLYYLVHFFERRYANESQNIRKADLREMQSH
jgi:hypothetical protein